VFDCWFTLGFSIIYLIARWNNGALKMLIQASLSVKRNSKETYSLLPCHPKGSISKHQQSKKKFASTAFQYSARLSVHQMA
jgi:hypothetical protein